MDTFVPVLLLTITTASTSVMGFSTAFSPLNMGEENLHEFQCHFMWALIIGFQLAFLLSFGMGANDVANAFGTSVGSGALSLKQAYFLASVMETLGAVLVGYNVIDTLRNKVVDLSLYQHSPGELMLGQVASLAGCTSWLLLATVFRLPVASSHSIVGAILGFTLLQRGTAGIHAMTVVKIVISWVIFPALSGCVSCAIYMVIDFAVLRRKDPMKCGLRVLPVFYFLCFAFNTFMVVYQGSRVVGLSDVPTWLSVLISLGVGLSAAIIFQLIVRPRVLEWIKKGGGQIQQEKIPETVIPFASNKKKQEHTIGNYPLGPEYRRLYSCPDMSKNTLPSLIIKKPTSTETTTTTAKQSSLVPKPQGFMSWLIPRSDRQEDQQTLRLFSTIQVFTGCFAGFAHGAMDVSHTIAPLVALLAIYSDGGGRSLENNAAAGNNTPLWLMFYGVSGICVGFWALGHRVMQTIGKRMTEINPCSGFTIEFGAALTVLTASKLGIPISTTHCLVGSVAAVGSLKAGKRGVDWTVFRNIVFSWLVTLPASALFSACVMFLFRTFLL